MRIHFERFFRISVVVKVGCCVFLLADFVWQLWFVTPVFHADEIAFYRDLPGRVHLVGRVNEEPDVRSNAQNLVVEVREIFLSSGNFSQAQQVAGSGLAKKVPVSKSAVFAREVHGKILVKAQRYPDYFYGDELDIKCKLQTPPTFENFSYASVLAEDDIFGLCIEPGIRKAAGAGVVSGASRTLGADTSAGTDGGANVGAGVPNVFDLAWVNVWSGIFQLKALMIHRINILLPQPQASMVGGILFGERRAIPEKIMADFNTAGLIHALTVSGYSFSVIMAVIGYWCRNAARRGRYAWIFLGVLGLVTLTGFSAKVLRAAWMASISLVAQVLGRKGSSVHLLLISAVIMVALSPRMVLVDLSFQFSFLSVLGILVLMPKFEAFEKKLLTEPRYARFAWIAKLPHFVREGFWVTVSAQLFTIPLLVLQSGDFSLISPFANIFVLPLVPMVMLCSFLALVGSFIVWPIGQFLGFLTYVLLTIMLAIVNFFVNLPFSTIHL